MNKAFFSAEPGSHGVQFYSDDIFLSGVVAAFLADGLTQFEPAVAIATAAHRAAITDELAARGIDVDRSLRSGALWLLDAEETLSRFMVNGAPDRERCKAVIGAMLAEIAGSRGTRVIRAYGEMVDVLWRAGNPDAAIALEVLWNELAMTHSFALLCGYSQAHVTAPLGIRSVCSQHTHVLPGPSSLA